MSDRRVSIALDTDNLLWLKSQAITSGNRSLSDTLNSILAKLRGGATRQPEPEPAFQATAKISESDPDLREADAAVRELFARSLARTADSLERPRAEPR